jgi:hypothetical protein
MKEAPAVGVGDRVRFYYNHERHGLMSVVALVTHTPGNGFITLEYTDPDLDALYPVSAVLSTMVRLARFSPLPADGAWTSVVLYKNHKKRTPTFQTKGAQQPKDASRPRVTSVVAHTHSAEKSVEPGSDLWQMVKVFGPKVPVQTVPLVVPKKMSSKHDMQATISASVMSGAWRGDVKTPVARKQKTEDLIARASGYARTIALMQNSVTSTDVFNKLKEQGIDTSGVDPRFMGAVFRQRGWKRVGYSPCGSHGRAVSVWTLA